MRKVLVLDGGGAKGILQNTVITEMENAVGMKSADIFDLIVGTSVGAINGAMHATGKFETDQDNSLFNDIVKKVFKRKRIIPPLYKDKEIKKGFDDNLGPGFPMKMCKTKFMCTAVSAVDKQTHFFRSWGSAEDEHLFDVVRRSFAAPLYFGQVVDSKIQQVWLDGGTGIANSPLIPAIEEVQRLDWVDGEESILLINIGTGYSIEHTPFNEAKKYHFLRQIGEFMDPLQGGLARYQSLTYQRMLLDHNPEILGVVADTQIPESLDKMDNIKAMTTYQELGKKLFHDKIGSNEQVMAILKEGKQK